LLNFYLATFS